MNVNSCCCCSPITGDCPEYPSEVYCTSIVHSTSNTVEWKCVSQNDPIG